jgi:thiol-disulfide isomerase/thioredoxin
VKSAICTALLCLFAGIGSAAATPGEVKIGGTLREAQMRGLSGPPQKLSEFRGMPLIINVWASWCGPCRQEMGALDRLAARNARRFRVIGISTDDYIDRARAALKQSKVGFANFIDRELELENMLGADRIPLTLLIDAKGRVVDKIYGAKEWDSPEAMDFIAKSFGFKP